MDSRQLDLLANCILAGGNSKSYDQLVVGCTPRILSYRKKLNQPWLTSNVDFHKEVVAEALLVYRQKGPPFLRYLKNSFRHICREWRKGDRRPAKGPKAGPAAGRRKGKDQTPASTPSILPADALDFPGSAQPDVEAQRKEVVHIVRKELSRHPPLSIRLVYLKFWKTPFPEMAEITGCSYDECRRVYMQDMYHLTKDFEARWDDGRDLI